MHSIVIILFTPCSHLYLQKKNQFQPHACYIKTDVSSFLKMTKNTRKKVPAKIDTREILRFSIRGY